ncbi:MAG: type IV pilus modification PilV family protein [Bacillota bacterium]
MFRDLFRHNHGYTFIELLVAITILGIVVTPFLALFSGSFLSIKNAGNQSTAINLCRAQMETVRSLGCSAALDRFATENGSGFVEDNIPGFSGFRRATHIQSFIFSCENQPSLEVEVLLIEISVTWTRQNKEHAITLSGYLSCR